MARSTVLVVDDSPMDRRLASALVARHPELETVVANHGRHALELIEQRRPDLVLTDLMMPEMDGLALVDAIRARHSALPIILMTAHGSEDVAVQALRRGAASYVPKRDLAKELVPTILGVLELATPERDQRLVLECLVRSEVEFRIGNTGREIAALVSHLETTLRALAVFDDTTRLQVGVALREALSNAAFHGNLELDSELREAEIAEWERLQRERPEQSPYKERKIHVQARLSQSSVEYVVLDDGAGFDPSTLPDPTDLAHLERVHGRGLLLMRTFMDEVEHNAKGNQITLRKVSPDRS